MLLKRKKFETDGLFQSIGYKFKPEGSLGLKAGGYFVSIEACQMIEEEFNGHASSELLREIALAQKNRPRPEPVTQAIVLPVEQVYRTTSYQRPEPVPFATEVSSKAEVEQSSMGYQPSHPDNCQPVYIRAAIPFTKSSPYLESSSSSQNSSNATPPVAVHHYHSPQHATSSSIPQMHPAPQQHIYQGQGSYNSPLNTPVYPHPHHPPHPQVQNVMSMHRYSPDSSSPPMYHHYAPAPTHYYQHPPMPISSHQSSYYTQSHQASSAAVNQMYSSVPSRQQMTAHPVNCTCALCEKIKK
jgi:hypothetical protein